MNGSFWGPERLRQRLGHGKRIDGFREEPSAGEASPTADAQGSTGNSPIAGGVLPCKLIDGASYRLSIGREIYISPSADAVDPARASVMRLKEREGFTVPPGQFAFLLTEECVPRNAYRGMRTEECVTVKCKEIAFLSIRARTKFRGLMNVSGFHVDPGFTGRLTFAVFNAGSASVHLRQGDEIFLIWYADLTDPVTVRRPRRPEGIQSDWIAGVGAGKLYSLAGIANSTDAVEQKLERRLDAVMRELAIFRVVAAIAVTALVASGLGRLRSEQERQWVRRLGGRCHGRDRVGGWRRRTMPCVAGVFLACSNRVGAVCAVAGAGRCTAGCAVRCAAKACGAR